MPHASFIFRETTPAAASTVASSSAVDNAASYLPAGVAGPLDDYDAVDVAAELRGATGGTLDVYLQISPNDGVDWFDIIHFPQLANGAAAVRYQVPLSNATTTAAPVVVGRNLTPALAANTVVNGAFSDRMRLVFVAGSSTNTGAAITVWIAPQRSRTREVGGD